RLTHWDLGEEIVLVSDGRRFGWTTLRLTDPFDVAAFRLLDQPHTVAGLVRKLPGATSEAVTALLRRWQEMGVLFTEAGQYIHVACEAPNYELLRIDGGEAAGPEAAGPEAAPDEPAQTATVSA